MSIDSRSVNRRKLKLIVSSVGVSVVSKYTVDSSTLRVSFAHVSNTKTCPQLELEQYIHCNQFVDTKTRLIG